MSRWYCPTCSRTPGFYGNRAACSDCCGFQRGDVVRISGDGSWLDAEDGRPRMEAS